MPSVSSIRPAVNDALPRPRDISSKPATTPKHNSPNQMSSATCVCGSRAGTVAYTVTGLPLRNSVTATVAPARDSPFQ